MVELNPSIILQGKPVDLADTYYRGYDEAQKAQALQQEAQAATIKANADAQKVGIETKGKQQEFDQKSLQIAGQIANGLLSLPEGRLNAQVAETELMANSHLLSPQIANGFLQRIRENPNMPEAQMRQNLRQAVMMAQNVKDVYDKQTPDANTMVNAQTASNRLDFDKSKFGTEQAFMQDKESYDRFNTDRNFMAGQEKQDWQQRFEQDKEGFHRYNESRRYGLDQQKRQDALNPRLSSGNISEDERKAAGWLAQADNAYKNMLSALNKSPNADTPGILESLSPDRTKGFFQDAERQMYTQAASSFSEAALRAATGAGVNKDEAAQKIKELTPEFWDKPELKKQKMESLKVYLESLKTRSNRAAPEGYQVPTLDGQRSGGWQKPDDWDEFMKSRGR